MFMHKRFFVGFCLTDRICKLIQCYIYKFPFFCDSELQCEGRVGLCENVFLLKEKAHRVREVPLSNVCDCC